MPTKLYDFKGNSVESLTDTEAFSSDGILSLIPLDDQSRYDPHGEFPESSIITLQEFQASDLQEFFGFEADEEIPLDADGEYDGGIGYQVSTDGGTTWQYADGIGWHTVIDLQDDAQWSTADAVDLKLPDLQWSIQDPRVKVRVRLVSSAERTQAPRLKALAIHHELAYDFTRDFKESIQAHLNDRLEIRLEVVVELETDANDFDLTEYDSRVEILSVREATNLTTLSGSIFDSYDSGSKVVTFTGAQTTGDLVKLWLIGRPPVLIGADEDYEISQNDAIVIEVPSISKRTDEAHAGKSIEKAPGRNLARIRSLPMPYDAETFIRCISDIQHFADAMVAAVVRILDNDNGRAIRSLRSGRDIVVQSTMPFTDTSDVDGNLWAETGNLTFRLTVPSEEYEEVALLKKLVVISGAPGETWGRTTYDFEQDTVDNEEI